MNMNKILIGDCLKVLPTLEAESVQCVVTSPPYWGLRDYNLPSSIWDGLPDCEHQWGNKQRPANYNYEDKIYAEGNIDKGHQKTVAKTSSRFCVKCNAWCGCLGLEPDPELYVEHLVQIFRQVRRILRKDGTVWLNLGDSYINHSVPGGGDPTIKKRNIGKLKYTPTKVEGLKPKNLCMMPARVALALQADGWYLRQDIIWSKPNPMPESVTDRCTKSHEYIFLLTKSAKYYYDADAIREPASYNTHERQSRANINTKRQPTDKINALRTPKAQKVPAGWDIGPGGHNQKTGRYPKNKNNPSFDAAMAIMPDTRNKRSVWTITTAPYPKAHFATFPSQLPKICILAGTKPSDLVMDPFSGSGTVGQVCAELARDFIGIELNPEYANMRQEERSVIGMVL